MYVIVIGGGKVGYYLSKHLLDRGYEVTLIEKDPRRAEALNSTLGGVVVGGGGEARSGPASARRGSSPCQRPSPGSITRPMSGPSRPWASMSRSARPRFSWT